MHKTHKVCPVGKGVGCGKLLPRDAFGVSKTARNGMTTYCKECERKRSALKNSRRLKTSLVNRSTVDPDADSKECIECNVDKLYREFYKHSHYPDGYDYYCAACKKALADRNFKAKRHHRLMLVRDGIIKGLLKVCRNCNISKPFTEFHLRLVTTDGLYRICKSCRAERDKLSTQLRENRHGKSDYQRLKANDYERVKSTAREYTHRLISSGTISQPSVCEGYCGEHGKLEAHHCDYSNPDNVLWLCPPCHALWHMMNTPVYPTA